MASASMSVAHVQTTITTHPKRWFHQLVAGHTAPLNYYLQSMDLCGFRDGHDGSQGPLMTTIVGHSLRCLECYKKQTVIHCFCWLPAEFGVLICFTCTPSPCCAGGLFIRKQEAFDNLTTSLTIVGL